MLDDNRQQAFEAALRAGAYESAWRYCCRLTASYEDAQDLLQESVGHALANYRQLKSQDSFRAWLLAIVRSRYLAGLRSRKLTVPLEEELLAPLEMDADAEHEAVLWYLRRLPAAQREVLELFYIHGLSLVELGMVLGVPAVAARHRLHRAREALRRSAQEPLLILPNKALVGDREK